MAVFLDLKNTATNTKIQSQTMQMLVEELSGYEESGPKVELWEGESVGKQSSHPEEDR